MKPHEQIVVDEKTALDEKLSALDSFIASNPIHDTLSGNDQVRLARQLCAMRDYSMVLAERIEAFPK